MKRFRFELQAVLELRQRDEEMAQQNYAAARQAHADARGILADLEMLKIDMMDTLHSLRFTGSIDPAEQVAYQRYLRDVARDIVVQQQILAEMEQSLEHCRMLLIDAAQDKEAVLNLRDDAMRAYVSEGERIQQNEVDELATLRHQFRAVQAKAA